jgi:polyribonucleotide nucleotidyltransferase
VKSAEKKREKQSMLFKVERQIGTQLLSIETGKIAKQASGSALVRFGDTVVLGTVVRADPRPGIDFFPLQVDYREKMSAAGRFPGGFFKREGRPTNKEVLTSRVIDRPIRPLFPKGFYDEVQIQVQVIATDLQHDPDVVGIVAAAAALATAPIPFQGPIAGVRVGRVDGKLIINPSQAEMEYSDLDLVLAGHYDAVNMIEIGAHELPEKDICDAIKYGHEHGVRPICELLRELRSAVGAESTWEAPAVNEKLRTEIQKKTAKRFAEAKKITSKQERGDAISQIYSDIKAEYCPEDAEDCDVNPQEVQEALQATEKKVIRDRISKEGVRSDGRKPEELREITCEVDWLPRVHGSSLFTRGETQAMVVTTLGTGRDEQMIDELMGEYSKKFMLHYNFPPFSVGEARRIMGPGRREIGHGALAERSLEPILPAPDDFAYTIRLLSDILESNGSSSMATVCGGTLALMDSGVPIKAPVAGISVGMITGDKADDYTLILDILGEEDHFGDMDFKVAGSVDGVTGVQLDLKARGLTHQQIVETFELARKGRLEILKIMSKAIAKPRATISENAPRMLSIKINPEKSARSLARRVKPLRPYRRIPVRTWISKRTAPSTFRHWMPRVLKRPRRPSSR